MERVDYGQPFFDLSNGLFTIFGVQDTSKYTV